MKNVIAAVLRRPFLLGLSVPAAVLVAILMLCISELSYRESASQFDQLVLKGQVRAQALQMLQRISDAESGKRGYLLVGGAEYMAPYVRAHEDVLRALGEMKRLYAGLHDAEGESRRLHAAGKPQVALDIVRSGIGRDLMDRIRAAVDELVQYENVRIASGLKGVYQTLWMSRIGVAAMTLVSLLVLVLTLFVRQGRELERQRVMRQAEIVEERDRLEAEVLRRTGDLTELARHLQTAREDERAHLARELHDELGAWLTIAKLDAARSGLDIQTRFEPASLSSGAQLTVYRVVQEALTNIVKYAQATTVQVSLLDEAQRVRVQDDGIGFDLARTRVGSHGLRGMRFRVESENALRPTI